MNWSRDCIYDIANGFDKLVDPYCYESSIESGSNTDLFVFNPFFNWSFRFLFEGLLFGSTSWFVGSAGTASVVVVVY